MQSTVPLNATLNKKLKQGAEAILRKNGVPPEETLTFLYQNIIARNSISSALICRTKIVLNQFCNA